MNHSSVKPNPAHFFRERSLHSLLYYQIFNSHSAHANSQCAGYRRISYLSRKKCIKTTFQGRRYAGTKSGRSFIQDVSPTLHKIRRTSLPQKVFSFSQGG